MKRFVLGFIIGGVVLSALCLGVKHFLANRSRLPKHQVQGWLKVLGNDMSITQDWNGIVTISRGSARIPVPQLQGRHVAHGNIESSGGYVVLVSWKSLGGSRIDDFQLQRLRLPKQADQLNGLMVETHLDAAQLADALQITQSFHFDLLKLSDDGEWAVLKISWINPDMFGANDLFIYHFGTRELQPIRPQQANPADREGAAADL